MMYLHPSAGIMSPSDCPSSLSAAYASVLPHTARDVPRDRASLSAQSCHHQLFRMELLVSPSFGLTKLT